MTRLAAVERSQYIGSIFHSLQRLPRWYQVVGVGGVGIAMYLRNTALIQWLVVYLHSSLGTESIWYPDYKVLLDYMTFNERIGFTLYGVLLAFIVLVVCKLCLKDQLSIDRAGSGLIFPSHKVSSVTVYVLMCVAEGFRLHCHIINCLSDPHSVAHSALHSVKSTTTGHFIHHIAGMNTHFVIQFEIFKTYLLSFVYEQVPVFVLACLFRLCRDVPRSAHAEFRWHMSTIAQMTFVLELFLLSSRRQWSNIGSLSLLVWAAIYLVIINYMYGPQKRSGLLVSATSRNAIEETVKRTFMCAVLWMIACLVVLTLVVSVHVIELVCIWLSIFMLIVWIPAIIDSGALEYIFYLTVIACYLFHEMGYLSVHGSVCLTLLVCVWWFNACLVYNVTVNAFHSRYMGMFVIAMSVIMMLMLAPSQRHVHSSHLSRSPLHNTSAHLSQLYHIDPVYQFASSSLRATSRWLSSEHILQRLANWILFLRSISEFAGIDKTSTATNNYSSSSSYTHHNTSTVIINDSTPVMNTTVTFFLFNAQRSISMYSLLLRLGVMSMFVLLSVNNGIGQFAQTPEIKLRLRRSSIPLINFTVALRKLIRTLVSVFCVIAFMCTWWTCQHYLLPRLLTSLPLLLSKSVSVVVACIVFGGVVDMRESIYEMLMRALGILNPPSRLNRVATNRSKGNASQVFTNSMNMNGGSNTVYDFNLNEDKNDGDVDNDNYFYDAGDDSNDEELDFMLDDEDGYFDSVIDHSNAYNEDNDDGLANTIQAHNFQN